MHLAEHRKKTGQSQADFGVRLVPPASQALISQWERGTTRITLDYAVQIDHVTEHEVSCEDCNAMYRGKDAAAA
jgi:DNA-binding transcriptional regulator YdaS (Cro superfamily)